MGKRWGDPISAERQAELQNYLDRWNPETDHGGRIGPFVRVSLSGADVYWLGQYSQRNESDGALEMHLEGADLAGAHLEGADLRGAHLERTSLYDTHLERANLSGAYLERAAGWAHLEGTILFGAQLGRAYLRGAHLEKADLATAHLEGADFVNAHLEGADLRGAWLDGATVLGKAALDAKTCLGDIHWGGVGTVDLTQIAWERVPILGDEPWRGLRAGASEREAAVRAYRQVAAQLRAQGLSEVADRFTYRAQIHQRVMLRKQRRFGGYLFSLLLAVLAGYGYRLGRIIIAYALIVGVFAAAFLASDVVSGQAALTVPNTFDALQISLNAVHGRVFFAQFHLDTVQSWLATAESIVGIVIEGVFVAMLIQRLFAR